MTHGSHIRSWPATKSGMDPTPLMIRRTSLTYSTAVMGHRPCRCSIVKPPESIAHRPRARGSVFSRISRLRDMNSGT
ncbi:hypothetical protein ACFV3E_40915 [Streptomyces sp. NPDC059718]